MGRLTHLNEARLKVGGCTNAAAGCNLPGSQHQARLRYARLASMQSIIRLAALLWGLIGGSGHFGQYQIGRLPWQFALCRAKEWPRVIEPHSVAAISS
jgi:hypothetical protein